VTWLKAPSSNQATQKQSCFVPASTYRRRPTDLVQLELGETILVFDPLTGETLYLSGLPSLIFAKLTLEPQKLTNIVDSMSGGLDLTEEDWRKIEDALRLLEGSELVESVP
jgi:hypothetical protein